MAYDIIAARGYGSAEDGDATNPATVNHYARVTGFNQSAKTITLAGDDLSAFTVGTEILLHLSGIRSASANAKYLGKYRFAKIMAIDGSTYTLSATPLNVTADYWFYQAVTVPHYNTLNITGTVSPAAFDPEKGCGGIFIFKAARLNMSGKINLSNKGLTEDAQRPLLNQEQAGTLDTDTYSGYENFDAANHFTLQKGDGAAFIIAKRIDFEDTARIGDPNYKGIARCRGASDSYNRNSEVSNIGGSSIVIVAPTINDFDPAIISKYRRNTLEAGKGLARCYIATESRLPNDEGLYAYDIINTPERLKKNTCISGFGNGMHGTARTASIQQNSYAKVSKFNKNTFTLTNIDSGGVAQFKRGELVMIHATAKDNYAHGSRFIVSEIVGITNDNSGKLKSITLEHSLDELKLNNFTTDLYNFQAIAIPQYTYFATSNSRTPAYDGKRGGIFAIAVKGVCDLRGKKINVEHKGGATYYLTQISNAQMKHRLPIGEGHGSVFILAETLQVDSSTRIGATYSGNAFGGAAGASVNRVSDGGYMGKRCDWGTLDKYDGYGGSGAKGGTQKKGHDGGFHSNAPSIVSHSGKQGASIFIVAETIDGLCLECLSTGGGAGHVVVSSSSEPKVVAESLRGLPGGCGYGGGGASYQNNFGAQGGVHGGGSGASTSDGYPYTEGGGSSGFCVVYANKFTNQSTANLSFD